MTATNERNRNALRTERMLRDAFVTMVQRGDARRISVASLCREADLNRSTFYAHYEDLDAFKRAIAEHLMNDVILAVMQIQRSESAEQATKLVYDIGRLYESNLAMYRAVVVSAPSSQNAMIFRDAMIEDCGDVMLGSTVLIDFLLSSLTAVYHTWAVGLYGDASADKVSEVMAPLIVGALGLAG